MKARRTHALAGALAGALLLFLTGCPKDPYDCDTWTDKLDDKQEIERAITELGRLKCPEAIDDLGGAWKANNYPARILRVIIDIADQRDMGTVTEKDLKVDPKVKEKLSEKEIADLVEAEKKRTYGPNYKKGPFWKDAIPFLVKAVDNFLDDNNNPRTIENATSAVDALGRAKQFGADVPVDVIVRAATVEVPAEAQGTRVRLAALRALGRFADDEAAVTTLITVLNAKPKDQHPFLFAAAADALATARNPKAVMPLVRAMYEIPPVYQFCRRSLVAIGDPAVDTLLDVFKLKNEAMNTFARDNELNLKCKDAKGEFIGGPKTKCKAPTNLEFKAASVLGDLRARKAIPALLDELTNASKGPMPAFFSGDGVPGPPQHAAVLGALKKMGADPKTADALLAYIKNPKTDEYLIPSAIDTYSYLTRSTEALGFFENIMLEKLNREGQDPKKVADADIDPQQKVVAGLAYARLANKQAHLKPLADAAAQYKKKADDYEKTFKTAEEAWNKEKPNYDEAKKKYDPVIEAYSAAKLEAKNNFMAALYKPYGGAEKDFEAAKKKWEGIKAQWSEIQGKNDPAATDAFRSTYDAEKKGYEAANATFKKVKAEATKLYKEKMKGKDALAEAEILRKADKKLLDATAKRDAAKKAFSPIEKKYTELEQKKFAAEGNLNDSRGSQRANEQNLARAIVGVKCGDDAKCYIGFVDMSPGAVATALKDSIPGVEKWTEDEKKTLQLAATERALLELSKLGEKARGVQADLLRLLPSTERFVREGVLLALPHVAALPCQDCVKVLDSVISEQESQTTLEALTADARVERYYYIWASGKK
jgi:hypothetical protein